MPQQREVSELELGIQKYDWEEVVKLEPKGYCEIRNTELGLVFHGPVDKIAIDSRDRVVITLKWVAQTSLPGRVGFGEWVKAPDETKTISFPNLIVPFWFEETPEKGNRVRFMYSLIYLEEVEGVDPNKVKGLVLEPEQPARHQSARRRK